MFRSPTLPSAKELVRRILEATMQKHGVTKLFVSEAPSTEQLKKKKITGALWRPSCAT